MHSRGSCVHIAACISPHHTSTCTQHKRKTKQKAKIMDIKNVRKPVVSAVIKNQYDIDRFN